MFVNLLEVRLPLPLTWEELGFTNKSADQIAHRVALKLMLEKQIDLGLKERVLITLDSSGGKFEVVSLEKWLDDISVPLDLAAIKKETDLVEYFTVLIIDALVHAGQFFKKDVSAMSGVKSELLLGREDSKINLPFKTVTIDNYLLEPYLIVKGRFSRNTQLYVGITDVNSKKTGTWMFIEAQTPEVLSAVSSFSVENGFLIAKNEANKYSTSLQNRGFRFPLRVELSRILD